MPYGLGTVWNVTSKYIYTDPASSKNVGIGNITPICALDVFGDIAEKGILLEEKYNLKPENNKKYDLIVRENIDTILINSIIIYQFNKDSFNSNLATTKYGTLETIGKRKELQKEYYVGTGSAEINENLYYKIHLGNSEFNKNKYSICFWLFLDEESSDKYILYTEKVNNNVRKFSLKYNNKKLQFITFDNNIINSNRTLNKNEWYHISITIDNGTTNDKFLMFFINGVNDVTNQQQFDFIGAGDADNVNIYLGYSNNQINGYIDDFRIYEDTRLFAYTIQNIIGKITKITPGNISANGNYGIDIVNYLNMVNVGSENKSVDLTVYGDLEVKYNLKVSTLIIDSTSIPTLASTNLTVHNNLTVNKDITENQRKLSDKYALIGSIDKHTDVIISKMIDVDDVDTLYNEMLTYFINKLIIAYDFDFNKDDLNNHNYFFNNVSRKLNTNTENIYIEFAKYDVIPVNDKPSIDYYGDKYVKGNSSLKFASNTYDYYYFNVNSTDTNATFHSGENYTITFWVRFKKINHKQHILKFGDTNSYINLYLNNSNLLEFENYNNDESFKTPINEIKFNKDEWYHISILLKNDRSITDIPKNTGGELLIKSFIELEYTSFPYLNQNNHTFNTLLDISTVFIYINGINVCQQTYPTNITIFDSIKSGNINYFGNFDSTSIANVLNGYIDDFKMYNCLIPISYINEYIIGDALVIKPGQLSAIGNYGINIKNFTNEVTVGNDTNIVDLSIYGLLKSYHNKITISNVDIDVINNNLITSNLTISDILTVNCNIADNIQVNDTIKGTGFSLGSNDYIDTIKIAHIIGNSNILSSNITTDIININKTLVLSDSSIIDKLNITNINIDNIVKSSNNYITVYSNLIIGNNLCNINRYDFSDKLKPDNINKINANNSNFSSFLNIYPTAPLKTINPNNDISIYNKPFIFYGIDNKTDIQLKNAYIRNTESNIKDEIFKSYKGGEDRHRTRIKTDVGNIKVQNGYIEIYNLDILSDSTLSRLILYEDDIEIKNLFNLKLNSNGYYFSNHNYTTTLNDSLRISNVDRYSTLTSSNFLFNNGNGFTDNNTLKINTIQIDGQLEIPTITTNNEDSNILSINTSNSSNPFGRIQGYLYGNSKIDINYEIKTSSNIEAVKGIFNIIEASNIILGDTAITSNNIKVKDLIVTGSITLGADQSSGDNNIDGGLGTLQIARIKTTNTDDDEYSIDTGINGRIRGLIAGDSIIDITGDITTTGTLNASFIEGTMNNGNITENSIININCNITTTAIINASNIIATNTLSAINLTGPNNTRCSIKGQLTSDSIIDIDGNITTTGTVNVGTSIISSNNVRSDTVTTNNINSDFLNINTNVFMDNYNINVNELSVNNVLTDINILKTLNIKGTVGNTTITSNVIKCNKDNNGEQYMRIDGTGLHSRLNSSLGEYTNIISYNSLQKLIIRCDILQVASFDVGNGTQFSFPNIISYNKNDSVKIPNVYIGNNTGTNDLNEDKDVLFVDTPTDNSRLRTGNLLVESVLRVGKDGENEYLMKIFTSKLNTEGGNNTIVSTPFTNFTTADGNTIISCSHNNQSVGINVQPPIGIDENIKLFVAGGIQTSDDIIAFKNISDRRFKTNIVSFTDNDISIVNKLNPVRFRWKSNLFNSNMANKNDIGFIAQEVKEIIPEAVSTCKIELNNIDYHYINYERIIPYLVNNIKYLNNKIVELENKINGL